MEIIHKCSLEKITQRIHIWGWLNQYDSCQYQLKRKFRLKVTTIFVWIAKVTYTQMSAN